MQIIDFGRSFLTLRIDLLQKPPQTLSHPPPYSLNNARIQIDCVCRITEKQTGRAEEFVLGASCKTERVGVQKEIFTQPNADFIPVLSLRQYLHLKAFDHADKGVLLHPPSLGVQPERQSGWIDSTFDRAHIDLCLCQAEVMESADQIVKNVLANRPLVARTEMEHARYRALIEYPIKTINANERDMIYQTDTGPVLLPDLSREPDELIRGMDLAFAAFNCPDWTEFIIRTKTPIAEGLQVYHYSETKRLNCKNELLRLRS